MPRNAWFETVAEAQRRAKRILPGSVYGALIAGSEKGTTIDDNLAAFSEVGVTTHVVGHHADRDLSTTVLGIPVSMPVIVSPTGVQAVHPDGEVAVARAARNRGTIMGLSSFASKAVEEVAAANEDLFFQVYWTGTKEQMVRRIERARAAGAKALIVTTDWSFSNGRDWGSPTIPDKLDLRTMVRFAPNVLPHPRWLYRFGRQLQIPDLTVPNLKEPGQDAPTFFGAYYEWLQTPPPQWEDIAWIKERWGGPLILKGVTRIDDALRAADLGIEAISVSNHGGNDLDTMPATLRVLPGIVDAVGDRMEVLLDGGVRRGSDVAKALALGARAVLIGRAYLWGLAANGQAGVENVFDILRGGLDSFVLGTGHASVHELSREDLVVPPGFERAFGGTDAEAPRAGALGTTAPRSKDPVY